MKDINLKFDLKADPKTIGLLGAAVFVASRAGARRIARRMDTPGPRPYTNYSRLGARRSYRGGSVREILTSGLAQIIDRGIFGDPQPSIPHYDQPRFRNRREQELQQGLDRINNRLDAILEIMPDKTETISHRTPGTAFEAAVETKDGVPTSVLLEDWSEATELVDQMTARVSGWEAVTVSDLNELLGAQSKYADTKRGWTSTDEFTFDKTEDGVRLILPPAVNL